MDTIINNIRASLIAQLVKNPPAMQEIPVRFLGQEDPLEKGLATHSSMLGLPWWLSWKETACNAGDLGSIPGMGRSPGEENGYPLQSSDLENSMGCIVHGVAKGWPPLSDFHFQSFPGGSDRKESASNARCLENPRDRGAWWAAVYGVAQSQTRLK